MAIFIPITKVEESETQVVYHYGRDGYEPDPGKPKRQRAFLCMIGRLTLNKRTGETVRTAGEDWDLNDRSFSRVCHVLARRRQKREFPKQTCYAA